MRAAIIAALAFIAATGTVASLIHNHHHLLGQAADESEHQRGVFLEVGEEQQQDVNGNACGSKQHPLEQAILGGSEKASAFGGIPENCGEGYGCKSEYWGKWCRFKHGGPPQCPPEVQEDLQGRLRRAAADGHQWAREILLVRPCEMFTYLEGRTLWIIGDSMSKDFAFAFQCFMLEFWDREDTGRWPTNPSLSPNVSDDPNLMKELLDVLKKLESNTAKPWSLQWCVPMFGGTRMCFLRANEGSFVARDLMPLLPKLASPEDVVLLNFGLHTNDNGTLWGYIQELEDFGEQYQQHKAELPQFLWRQTSVQHFETIIGARWALRKLLGAAGAAESRLAWVTGEWVPDKPQQEQRCVPIRNVQLLPDGSLDAEGDALLAEGSASDMTNALDTLLRGGRRNVRSAVVMGKLGIPVVHIWNQTVPFWDFHKHYHDPSDGTACSQVDCDCTHICVPSWHQMWMAALQQSLSKIGRRGSPRVEEWGEPVRHAIPGINVPLRYIPGVHNISSDPQSHSRSGPRDWVIWKPGSETNCSKLSSSAPCLTALGA